MRSNTNRVQSALTGLAISLQQANNSGFYDDLKPQITAAFSRTVSIETKVQLHATHVDAQPESAIAKIEEQCGSASFALDDAVMNSQLKNALKETKTALDGAAELVADAPGFVP